MYVLFLCNRSQRQPRQQELAIKFACEHLLRNGHVEVHQKDYFWTFAAYTTLTPEPALVKISIFASFVSQNNVDFGTFIIPPAARV
jgi:hypothetical protein